MHAQAWAADLKVSGQQLDYAIHVAGVVDDYADLDEVDEQRMLHCFRTNAIGPVLTVQALLEQKLLGSKSVLAIVTSKVQISASVEGPKNSFNCKALPEVQTYTTEKFQYTALTCSSNADGFSWR